MFLKDVKQTFCMQCKYLDTKYTKSKLYRFHNTRKNKPMNKIHLLPRQLIYVIKMFIKKNTVDSDVINIVINNALFVLLHKNTSILNIYFAYTLAMSVRKSISIT